MAAREFRRKRTENRIQKTVGPATVPTVFRKPAPSFSKRSNSSLCQREVGRDFQSVRPAAVVPACGGSTKAAGEYRSQNPELKSTNLHI